MVQSRFRLDWRAAAILGGILVVALLARLLAWQFHPIVSVDGTTYIRLAQYLRGGPFIDTQQPPGYPALIALLIPISPGGDTVAAARLVDLVTGVLLLVPFFFIARHFLGRWPAGFVTLLLALTPLAIRYSVTTMSESPYLLFILLAVLAVVKKQDAASGALAGLAFLVRPEGIVLPLGLAAVRGKPRSWVLVAIGFLVAGIVPALLFNHHTTGKWTLSRKVVNITGDDFWQNEVANTMGKDAGTAAAEPSVIDRLKTNSGAIARSYPDRLLAEITNLGRTAGWPFTIAVLPALIVGPRLPAAGLLQGLLVPRFPGVPPVARLVLPLLPFVLLLGFLLAERLGGRRSAENPGRPWDTWPTRLSAAVLVAGWVVAAIPEAKGLKRHEDGFYPELAAAGEAMKPFIPASSLIFDRKPYTAFYAGARYETTPLGGYNETLNEIIRRKGDYLVVSESVSEFFRPSLLPLVRDSATMLLEPRLELIYFDPTYLERHVAIYRVVRSGGPPPMKGPGLTQLRRVIAERIPHDPKLHARHAELLAMSGRNREAIDEYELAIALNRAPADLANLASLLITEGRDLSRAVELAEEAARLEPANETFQAVLVRAHRSLGNSSTGEP